MIEIAGRTYAFDDPLVLAALGAGALVLLVLILLIMAVRRAGRSADLMSPMIHQMNALGQRVESLTAGQQQLAGGLTHVSEAQAASQAQMLRLMEQRLAEVSTRMQENLQGTATRTAQSLGELQQRLVTIDRAQANIEKLSGDVLSLQDILSNKQTRGAFGEIQLHDIVSKALPSDSLRAPGDAVERAAGGLPDPPAEPAGAHRHRRQVPARGLRGAAGGEDPVGDVRGDEGLPHRGPQAHPRHRRALRDRGRDGGRGADVPALGGGLCRASRQPRRDRARGLRGAGLDRLAHHLHGDAEHHARDPEGRADARAGGRDPQDPAQLHRDVEMVVERVGKLDTHFRQAREDLDGITTAAERAGKRAERLDNFDFEELAPDDAPLPLKAGE
jgi:DNA recombination protein RmuC